MKKSLGEEEIVINLAATLLGVEAWTAVCVHGLQQQPFFMLLLPAISGCSLGSGDACSLGQRVGRACAHNAPCTGEPQKKFNELAASMRHHGLAGYC